VTFGARGIASLTLVAYGPRVAQHSGHYGNFVPNPAFDLARILGTLKSAEGVVTVPGFYAGIEIGDELRTQLAKIPDDEAAILNGMGGIAAGKGSRIAPGSTAVPVVEYPRNACSMGW
jgi:sugar phosphate isomerase/epimerase